MSIKKVNQYMKRKGFCPQSYAEGFMQSSMTYHGIMS